MENVLRVLSGIMLGIGCLLLVIDFMAIYELKKASAIPLHTISMTALCFLGSLAASSLSKK
ncbi:MAG: hypothetical protein A2W51_00715 [Candidatus Zambryskibacteria bacterium RIFCSPHIGHO2_02_39_10]|nr:MAG: hypothetical protein A2W51_00715 [Candidatus Zambryskibacteria bacterium RIFCSPHIGHO2_02_39_10]